MILFAFVREMSFILLSDLCASYNWMTGFRLLLKKFFKNQMVERSIFIFVVQTDFVAIGTKLMSGICCQHAGSSSSAAAAAVHIW